MRVWALAYALGGRVLADTYNVANNTPNIVFELILGGVLTATLVPLFVDAFERDDDEAASAIFGTAMALLVVLTLIAIAAAPLIAHLFTFRRAHGVDRVAAQRVATDLIRLFIPQIVFYGLTALLERDAQRAPALPRRGLHAGAQQRRRDRAVPDPSPRRDRRPPRHHPRRAQRPAASPARPRHDGRDRAHGPRALPAVRAAGIHLRFIVSWKHPAVPRPCGCRDGPSAT